MKYELVAVVDETQGLDGESHLVLRKNLSDAPAALDDFVGGQGLYCYGSPQQEFALAIRPSMVGPNVVEVGLGTATFNVSSAGRLAKGRELNVTGLKDVDKLIINFVGTR